MKRRLHRIIVPLMLILVILAGCTPVGGFDINKALLSSIAVKSGESSQKLSIEIVPAEGKLTAEEKKAIDLINSLSLTVDNAKVKDANTLSIKGSIGYEGKKLPIELSMDEKAMVLQIEGAKSPIYFSLEDYEFDSPDLKEYQDKAQALSTQVIGLIFKHFPNPSTLSVKKVQDKVHGETLDLTQVSAEINGEELLGLIKPFLTSLSKDEQGLKEVIGAVYDMIYSLNYMYYDQYEEEEEDSSALLSQKDTEIAALYGIIQQGLVTLVDSYDEQIGALLEEAPEVTAALNKETSLKVDLYFDSELNSRKQVMDLHIALPASQELPIKAIKLHSESESWNVGGEVAIDKIDTSAGVLDVTYGAATPGDILRNFDKTSDVYKVLKNDLKITQKYLLVDAWSDYDGVITKGNTSFIPLRYFSEQLDAEVKWNKGSNQITITDDITGLKTVITIGSKEALVGDKTLTLAGPAFVHKDGTTYVPLRFIAEVLGATVESDSEGWITIQRQ
jgi:hypothetical protein